ncbi:hypothetical protein AB0N28_01360 [Streptomyces sp. NPDC051130]|uniref:hypothetical protein n=1 Tax=Streptomyces sp. NPDC051130 TaxID=3157223 RepID=UPI00344616BE
MEPDRRALPGCSRKSTFLGPRPIHGDSLVLWIDDAMFSIKGALTCQGILENGRGYAALTLPDAGPEQRCALDRCKAYGFELYLEGGLIYSSPPSLTLSGTSRTSDGSLVVKGAH